MRAIVSTILADAAEKLMPLPARAGLERSALRKHKRKRRSRARSQANRVTKFTLTLWLYMDMSFAQMQNLKLGRSECVERLTTIRGDRGSRLVKGQCIGAGVYVLPSDRPPSI